MIDSEQEIGKIEKRRVTEKELRSMHAPSYALISF